jgi:hypothetical protein
MAQPKYPDVTVKLTGENGNAFVILGKVRRALREAGIAKEEIDACMREMQAGDYDHLLGTAMRWVEVT